MIAHTQILSGSSINVNADVQRRLEAVGLDARLTAAHELFVVGLQYEPTLDQWAHLRTLLDAAPLTGQTPQAIAIPRFGTVSPWSSKAQDIVARCGIDAVERVERATAYTFDSAPPLEALTATGLLHDPMTETLVADLAQLPALFAEYAAGALRRVALAANGIDALAAANRDWGLALSDDEVAFLAERYQTLGRDPTDVELMMFGQINSEHCRHKIFNAAFDVDGERAPDSLFEMIRTSHRAAPNGVLSAYSDNSAVLAGPEATRLLVDDHQRYRPVNEPVHLAIKVETHNHPTAIAPGPGAATGAGGEIRDEAATGRGGFSKAGVTGFAVADLRLPGDVQPWETDARRPSHLQSALAIMRDGPIGAARYNNEFGRPNLAGFFRTLTHDEPATGLRAYHKPIMIAGGMGNMRPAHVAKQPVEVDARLVVLGGPAMRIGLGGGATSSLGSAADRAELDFASVQRANPEIQRRTQQVIDACVACADNGGHNPIVSIHDVGAGGLSNALPELVHADDRGGHFQLRDVQAADTSLSPAEIWCNEAQERFVLAITADDLDRFRNIAERERCPFSVVGQAIAEPQLRLVDTDTQAADDQHPVDLPMDALFDHTPRLTREAIHNEQRPAAFAVNHIALDEAANRVLRIPSVASKAFLITIGDRSIGGRTARDQMVGPWQVPVADVAVTTTTHDADTGEAMAIGERPGVALVNSAAAARLAVGEAITNIAAASIDTLSDVRLSANWMAAAGDPAEDAALYDAVRAVGQELAPALGISIPVGKDSLSMQAAWRDEGTTVSAHAPVSLVITGFAPVRDAAATHTPQLAPPSQADTELLLFDLGAGADRLGGSALAQAFDSVGETAPDLDDPARLIGFVDLVQRLTHEGYLLAYHDRSDGGLFACIAEMLFAGRVGVDLALSEHGNHADNLAELFSEELGAVVQVERGAIDTVQREADALGVPTKRLGAVTDTGELRIQRDGKPVYAARRADLQQTWAATSYAMQHLRDDAGSADAEFDAIRDERDPGLPYELSFQPDAAIDWPRPATTRPAVAILREQGVNGHAEMAAAFTRAGFDAYDLHMSDLKVGSSLAAYQGLAACGGFSYGDVLGAGRGWAYSILFDERLRRVFADFFARPETFTLGVCNGCQMLAELADIIPGADGWPRFTHNASRQFEGRTSAVEIAESNSVLLAGMAGTRVPIAVAHGEGRVEFPDGTSPATLAADYRVGLRFVDHYGSPTTTYPANPNGSPDGITGVTSRDGRVLLTMPHPERVTRMTNLSWAPRSGDDVSPWARLFTNARRFVD
ncbi:phosphoribosylformylglycinamidine synthase [Salinisphaera orenii]|uniref:phosphoribosylformylglycinamidine synthase n=1 Tax=Salinisphaera orenii TaxID=856731 RepID=UPI000DBE63FA